MSTLGYSRALMMGKRDVCAEVRPQGWTDQDILDLRRYAAEGKSGSQIAALLPGERSRNSIIGKCFRLKIKMKGVNPRNNGGASASLRAPNVKKGPRNPLGNHAVSPSRAYLDPTEEAGLVVLLELSPHTCRWPIGDPRASTFRFCGRRPDLARPYCCAHSARAFMPTPPPRDLVRQLRRYAG